MRRLANVVLGLASLGLLASCTSDDAAFTPRRTTGGTDAAALEDASPPADAAVRPDAAPADPCAGRILCDSFESASAGAAPGVPWKILENSGTVTVSTPCTSTT